MFLLDIDGTISPYPVGSALEQYWNSRGGYTTRTASFFDLSIANYTLDMLRSTPDVFMLSTWGAEAAQIPEIFEFDAETVNYLEYSQGKNGIEGKFEVVKAFTGEVRAWADDHIREEHLEYCLENGILAVRPSKDTGLTLEEVELLKLAEN